MTTTNVPDPTLRLSSPGDVIAAVPYLLGFHPADSLVLVGLDTGGRLIVTARLDHDDLAIDHRDEVLARALAAMRRGGTTDVITIAYTDTSSDLSAEPIAEAVQRADLTLVEQLAVTAGRWRSLTCTDPTCCPPTGQRVPADRRVAAELTLRGQAPLPDRDSIAAQLAPLPEDHPLRVTGAELAAAENGWIEATLTGRQDTNIRSVTRALFRAARTGDPLDTSTAARFADALRSNQVRDPLWIAIDKRRLDADVLRQLAVRLPSPYDAVPLFLHAWQAWRAGDGARAAIAVQRALRSDGGYTAADLLLAALEHGLDPQRLPRLSATSRSRTSLQATT